jgi:antitoxin component YwqK of YwqJK toxin-antitoxin module
LKPLFALILAHAIFAAGCNSSDINDKEKRNDHWDWWVDASSGKGKWISLSDHPTWKNGAYTSFYYDGKVFEKGIIKDGKYVDTSYEYDRSGKLYILRIYLRDSSFNHYLKDGPVKVFGKDGRIRSEGLVQNHKPGNRWIEYYNSGSLKKDFNYFQDTGWVVEYYENGRTKDSSFHINDSSLSLRHWYESGQIAQTVGRKNNNYDGLLIDYYENGQIQQTYHYVDGKPDGKTFSYYESGKIKVIENLNNGVKNGQIAIYFENGQIQLDAYMVNGKLDGEQKMYDEKGKLVKDLFFQNGLQIK